MLQTPRLPPEELLHCLLCTSAITADNRATFPGCHHIFHWSCLKVYYDTLQCCTADTEVPRHMDLQNYTTVTCPVCRKTDEGLRLRKDVPVSHRLYSVLESVKEVKKKKSSASVSGQCGRCSGAKLKQHKSKWVCIGCQVELCPRCFEQHEKQFRESRHSLDHLVVTTEKLQTELKFVCRNHSKGLVSLFCESCKSIICQDCAKDTRLHKGHQTQTFQSITDQQTRFLESTQAEIQRLIQEKQEQKHQIQALLAQQLRQYQATENDINRHVAALVTDIEKHKQRLLTQLCHQCTLTQKLHDNHNIYLDYTIGNLSWLRYFLQELRQPGHEPIAILHRKDVTDMVQGYSEGPTKLREQTTLDRFNLLPKYTQKMEVVGLSITGLGEIRQEVPPAPVPPIPLDCLPKMFMPRIHTAQKRWSCSPPLAMQSVPIGLAFTDNALLVAQYQGMSVSSYSRVDGQKNAKELTIPLPRLPETKFFPRDILNTPEGDIYVTDDSGKTIQCFSSTGELQKPPKTLKLRSPSGIALSNSGKELIISDILTHSISIYNRKDFELLRSFGGPGSGDKHFRVPEFLMVDDANRIIISDRDNNRLCAYTMEGKYVMEFGNRGSEAEQVGRPGGVCGDHSGNILVVDSTHSRICIFSPEGQFMNSVVTFQKGSRVPYGIALTENGELAVSDRAMPYIDVYQI